MEAFLYIIQNYSGLAMPIVIDFVNKQIKSSKGRFWASIGISIVLGTLLNVDKVLASEWTNLLGTVSFIFAQSQIVYKTYWENSGTRAKLYGVDKMSDPAKVIKN